MCSAIIFFRFSVVASEPCNTSTDDSDSNGPNQVSDYPASELLFHTPHTRGWQTPKCAPPSHALHFLLPSLRSKVGSGQKSSAPDSARHFEPVPLLQGWLVPTGGCLAPRATIQDNPNTAAFPRVQGELGSPGEAVGVWTIGSQDRRPLESLPDTWLPHAGPPQACTATCGALP
jgi:hypothetical protein